MFFILSSITVLTLGVSCVCGDVLMKSRTYDFGATATDSKGKTIPVNGSVLNIQLVYLYPKGREEYGDAQLSISADVPEGGDRAFYELDLNAVPAALNSVDSSGTAKGGTKKANKGASQILQSPSLSDFLPPRGVDPLFDAMVGPDLTDMLKVMDQPSSNARRTRRDTSTQQQDENKTASHLSQKAGEGPEVTHLSQKAGEGPEVTHLSQKAGERPQGNQTQLADHRKPATVTESGGASSNSSANVPAKVKNSTNGMPMGCNMASCNMTSDNKMNNAGNGSASMNIINSWLAIFVSSSLIFFTSTKFNNL